MLHDEAVSILGESGKERLKSFVQRIENLETEKKAISEDIKEVYAQAKGDGFDVPTLRTIVKLRRMDDNEIQEQDALLDTYRAALGMAADGSTIATDAE